MLRTCALFCPLLALSACAEAAQPRPTAPGPAPPAATRTRSAVPPEPTSPAVAPDPPAPWPPRRPTPIATDWCTGSVHGLGPDVCFYLPEEPTTTLLIYLHGVVPPEKTSVQKTTYQAVVANASRRAKAAALMPRGKQGLAPKGLEKWWGWPTSPDGHRRFGAELVEKINGARRGLEAASGVSFDRVYLAGSSSGAYFVAALAQLGGIDVDGFGAMSGGTTVQSPAFRQLEPRPVYIGYGLYDTVGESSAGLAKLLRAERWPVRLAEHRVGHGAKEIYLDEAFPFWREHVP